MGLSDNTGVKFFGGRRTGIAEAGRTGEPALPVSEQERWEGSDEEFRDHDRRCEEHLTGRTMFVAWGGFPVELGYPVTVVADGPKEWVVRKEDGRFEVLTRYLRDRVLFDSRDHAAEARLDGVAELERTQAEYEKKVLERSGR